VKKSFDVDPYLQSPKILFIGLGSSTHTHAWINLLSDSSLNVRLFALPNGGMPPENWDVRTYLPHLTTYLPLRLNELTRKTLYFPPGEFKKYVLSTQRSFLYRLLAFAKNLLNRIGTFLDLPVLIYDFDQPEFMIVRKKQDISPEAWLAQIIKEWKPDVIHTLGLFDGQGGEFYYNVRRKYNLKGIGKWVLQTRGGSDLELNRFNPGAVRKIVDIAQESDDIICDNVQNVIYLKQMGVSDDKFSSLTPVPGTGGVDVEKMKHKRLGKTSDSRIIIYPKAYESQWSKSLPVLEALSLCWDRIQPCTIHIFNMYPETEPWFQSMPMSIKENCIIHDRVSHMEFFDFLAQARVLLIPSLVDGVPNSLYEAMSVGIFPIVSPLPTIRSVVRDEENVLFARNLYPDEIAAALSRAMTDNELVNRAAQNNLELVLKIGNRSIIAHCVIDYYKNLVGNLK
jgi:glycosyltransferase involved in cell wall biosynthesis